MRLSGRIAVVTGAASGIGLAVTRRLAGEGAAVYLTDVDGSKAGEAAAELSAQGLAVKAYAVDVSRGQEVRALMNTVETTHGRIDILVNNAGLNVRADFRHLTDEEWAKIRGVNLDGMVRVARDGFGLLKASGRGSLINVSSIMAHRGLRQLAAYSATKGAISALTRALAVEYAPFNIRVNTVAPGFIETALTERVLKNPSIRQALLDQTPLGRFGTGDDVAEAVLFLASDAAAFITGAEIAVDGGMSAGL